MLHLSRKEVRMRNTLPIALFFVSLWTSFSLAEEGQKPLFRATARVERTVVLEEPLRGFEAIAVYQLNESLTNRFNSYWYINALSNSKDRNYPANQFAAAFKGGAGDALRQYFVEDFATSLPIFMWLQDQVEYVTSGKVTKFIINTFAGDTDRNQITSPFSSTRFPLQPINFSEHRFNVGLRPFSNDNPYFFAGYTIRLDSEEILDLQCRVHLKDWVTPVPEVVIRVPLENWSLGAGLRYENGTIGFQSNDDRWNYEQGLISGVTYFIGLQGPVLGGWFFISTGYPVPVTVLYSRPF